MEIGYLVALAGWGLVLGLVVGFTSIGTGILGTPGLIILFHIHPMTAVGSVTTAAVFMMATGALRHFRSGNVDLRTSVFLSITAFPAAFLLARHAERINQAVPLEYIIAGIIALSIPLVFLRTRRKPVSAGVSADEFIRPPMLLTLLMGGMLGAIIGATGITGSVTLIVLILVLKLPERIAVGTTAVVGTLSLVVASAGHIMAGHVEPHLVVTLLPGVVIGAWIGARFVEKVSVEFLRYAVLVILAVSAVFILI